MKVTKSIVPALLVFILIFSTLGSSSASNSTSTGFYGSLSVDISPSNAKVGDTVYIYVTADNNGLGDWESLKIYAPIPAGLQYESHTVPDRVMKDYSYTTGIWNVMQMKWTGRGHSKELVITTKVLPEAAGKTITATASFNSLIFVNLLNQTVDEVANGNAPPAARSATLTISPINNTKTPSPDNNTTKNPSYGPGSGPGSGLGSGSGTGKGSGLSSGNLTTASGNDPLTAGGGGGNGKAYEVYKNPSTTQDSLAIYILAALLIIGLLIIGYFYGIKRDE